MRNLRESFSRVLRKSSAKRAREIVSKIEADRARRIEDLRRVRSNGEFTKEIRAQFGGVFQHPVRGGPSSRVLRKPARGRRFERGFTLVEMLIAMGILVIGVTSILGLLMFGAALQRTAERRSEVSLILSQAVSELREVFPLNEDGSVGEPPAVVDRDIPGHPGFRLRAKIVKNPSFGGEYFASIEISWLERGKARGETFRTVLQREASFDRRVGLEYQKDSKK